MICKGYCLHAMALLSDKSVICWTCLSFLGIMKIGDTYLLPTMVQGYQAQPVFKFFFKYLLVKVLHGVSTMMYWFSTQFVLKQTFLCSENWSSNTIKRSKGMASKNKTRKFVMVFGKMVRVESIFLKNVLNVGVRMRQFFAVAWIMSICGSLAFSGKIGLAFDRVLCSIINAVFIPLLVCCPHFCCKINETVHGNFWLWLMSKMSDSLNLEDVLKKPDNPSRSL